MLILLLPFLIVSGIIFVTVDLAILFREKIASSYGNSFYLSVYFILAIYVIWSAVSAYRSGKLTAKSASSLILSSVIYFLILRSFDYPIERIHFVEYGALAISAIHGLRKRYAFKTALAAAVLLSTLTGLVDEFIQYIHPDRVGEIRDVLINLSAALLGAAVFAAQTWPGKKVETELHYAGKKLLLSLTLAVLICSLIFLETAHGYGYKINTVENTAFRSSFTAEELAKLNEDYADKKESSAISSFVNEAERHLFQRNLYASKAFPARNGKVYYEHGKSLKENIILEKHYMAYLKERGALWNDSMRTHITKKGAWLLSKPWTSRVKETMFTDTNKWAVRIIFAAAILLLPLPFVGLKRS